MCGQACPNYPKSKLTISQKYIKKEVRDKVNLLQIGTMMGIVKHSQSSQDDKFAQNFES